MSILQQFRLDGKRALVTGGSRGLGRAMAQSLAEAGADLVLAGRDEASLAKAQRELAELGRQVAVVQADLEKPAGAEDLCRRVLDQHGPIHILINNVGGRRENTPVLDQTVADWQRLLDLNLTSAFVCAKMMGGPMVLRGWGRIVNIASICGQIATKNMHGRHYEASKAALVGFTRALAVDWATKGVTVNAIAPGGFLTDANSRWFREKPELKEQIEALIPMARLGNPEELGGLAVYLASEASSYMTGALLVIDGGYTLW